MMPGEKSPETIETERKTQAALEAYVAAWRDGDKDGLLRLFADDAVWYDPAGTPPWEGTARIGEFWDAAHAAGTTLTPEVRRIVVCGNEGMLVFRMCVRMADGSGMGLEVCDYMVVNEEGRIQNGKAFWDDSCVGALDS